MRTGANYETEDAYLTHQVSEPTKSDLLETSIVHLDSIEQEQVDELEPDPELEEPLPDLEPIPYEELVESTKETTWVEWLCKYRYCFLGGATTLSLLGGVAFYSKRR
jgi:hypothetical protein